jgi:transposase
VIQLTPQMRILVAVEAVDFRKGIDGLAGICREKFKDDPFNGHVFVFCNRGKQAIKILMYDGQGFWLCQKRLSRGRLRWWPAVDPDADPAEREGLRRMVVHELQLLLWNGDPGNIRVAPSWRELP